MISRYLVAGRCFREEFDQRCRGSCLVGLFQIPFRTLFFRLCLRVSGREGNATCDTASAKGCHQCAIRKKSLSLAAFNLATPLSAGFRTFIRFATSSYPCYVQIL